MIREVDYLPWTGRPFTPDSQPEQPEWHAHLKKTRGADIHPTAFISPEARVFTESLKVGARSYIAADALVRGDIILGEDCTVNPFVSLHGKVTIGNGVRVASLATIAGQNHGFSDLTQPIHTQCINYDGIVIEDDVWVGANVVVLDGVKVEAHSILAAGAIVTKDVPPYSIVGGNPARLLRDRRENTKVKKASRSQEAKAAEFGLLARNQWPAVLDRCVTPDGTGYLNQPGDEPDVRPWCDAVEIAGAFGEKPALLSPELLIQKLQSFQDPVTGLFPDPRQPGKAPYFQHYAFRYPVLAVGYSLEILGAHLRHPVRAVEAMTTEEMLQMLDGLPWNEGAWSCGDAVDALGTALYQNARHFGSTKRLEPLWGWLNTHVDTLSGLWGKATKRDKWLEPVNGFYRLTRGTYAQFGVPLPHPVETIDTVLAHARNTDFFRKDRGNACHVLDVIHPLWLCRKQTQHRAEEIKSVALFHWQRALTAWVEGEGFSFDLEKGQSPGSRPGLQGTEMWLSIIYFMAELLEVSESLGYRPRGVHRPEVAFPTGP